MAERPMADAQGSTGGTATAPSGMSRGVAHALTTVLALFVGGFSLLLVLGRAQDDGGIGSHPLDFLVDFYRASGAVQVFFAVAIAWIAVFMAIVETVAACSIDRGRGFRRGILVELIAFAAFIALWYAPF